jgi:hypothetical protein
MSNDIERRNGGGEGFFGVARDRVDGILIEDCEEG